MRIKGEIWQRSIMNDASTAKKTIETLLVELHGEVTVNHNLDLPSRLEDYKDSSLFDALSRIHVLLQNNRGFDKFVRARKLPNVDFYLPGSSRIIPDTIERYSDM